MATSVRGRILGGFAVPLAIMVPSAAFGMWQIRKIGSDVAALTARLSKKAEAASVDLPSAEVYVLVSMVPEHEAVAISHR